MAAASRRDLVIEMLNDAKTSKEKLHVLIQIKEIVLFREPTLINEIVPEVLEFMLERTASMRKFLVEFSGEALAKSIVILPSVLNMYNYLVTDTNEDVVVRVTREIKKVYDKMVMTIVHIPPKTKQSNQADPKQMWQHLRTVTTRLVDVISSDRGESMRNASLTLAEAIVIFGLPAPPVVSHDPRLKGQAGLSAENVPLHHPFINRNELEQEAEDIFKKMLLWATRGGPQGHPFTPNQMSLLGQAIARIASQRPKKVAGSSAPEEQRGSHAAKALVFMLQNTKANVCKDMSGAFRSSLAKATHGLLRSPFASMHDPEGLVAKLRSALATLEALGFEDTVDTSSKKRTAGVAELGDGEDEMEDKKRRDEAISALDAAEQIFKAKLAHADEASGALAGAGAEGSAAATQKVDTELAGDLAVPFEGASLARAVLTNVTQKNTSSGNSEVVIKMVPQTVEMSEELATASLQRLLDSFYEVKSFSDKALVAHAKLTVRMAVSMALVAVAAGRPAVKVPIILSLPSAVSSKLTEGVTMDLPLPRPLWLLISFVLSPPVEEGKPASGAVKQALSLQAAVKEKLLIVVCLLDDLRSRAEEEGDAMPTGDYLMSHPCTSLYESVCTVVLARLLQNLNLRDLAKGLLTGLLWIPRQCLDLLKLLMHTGTKAAAATMLRVPGRKEVRNRGTRMEALTLLTYLVFAADQDAGTMALNHLLWCSVADDFETRSKAVTLLLNDVLPAGDWVVDVILSFACQAAGTLVGCDAVREGSEASRDIRAQVWALPSEAIAAADNEVNIKAEKIAGGGMEVDGAPEEVQEFVFEKQDKAVEEVGPEAKEEAPTLAKAMAHYDHGSEFGSSFSSITANTKEKYEANVKRSIQLLMQLCTTHPPLLGVVMDLVGAAVRALDPAAGVEAPEEAPMTVEAAPEGSEDKSDGAAPAAAPAAAPTPAPADAADTTFGPKQQCKVIMDVLRGELANIIPSIVQKSATDILFGYLARSDPFARPLLEHAVGVLHSDMHTPPTPRMIETINTYIAMNNIQPKAAMRLTVSLIGGMPSADVRAMLPHIISTFISNPEALNNIFSRIVLARPPALTKSALLVALHRYAPSTRPQIFFILAKNCQHSSFPHFSPPPLPQIRTQHRPRGARNPPKDGLR